jgi:putative DNA primase/helicase
VVVEVVLREVGEGRRREAQEGDALLVPVVGPDEALRGLQIIDNTGAKRFARGTSAAGALWWARPPAADHVDKVFVVEGVATALTVAEAIPDAAVACAFSAGNVPAVAAAVRERWPSVDITLALDADEAGRAAAAKARAADPRCRVRFPTFTPRGVRNG